MFPPEKNLSLLPRVKIQKIGVHGNKVICEIYKVARQCRVKKTKKQNKKPTFSKLTLFLNYKIINKITNISGPLSKGS